MAFEGAKTSDFLDLVMELRDTEASLYTLRDTPTFTAINMSLPEVLDSLGGAQVSEQAGADMHTQSGWVQTVALAELAAGQQHKSVSGQSASRPVQCE